MDWIVVIPKNKTLKSLKEMVEKIVLGEGIKSFKILECRGEDVPFFVDNLLDLRKKAIGITGEDLFKEWEFDNPDRHLDILRRYEWKDEAALFKKPVLCLMGPKDKTLETFKNKKIRIAIADKYKKLSKAYLSILEEKGYKFEIIYLSGSVEEAFSFKIVDLVIDIVSSGKSAKEAGLKCYEKIFESDIAVVGKKNLFSSLPKISIVK